MRPGVWAVLGACALVVCGAWLGARDDGEPRGRLAPGAVAKFVRERAASASREDRDAAAQGRGRERRVPEGVRREAGPRPRSPETRLEPLPPRPELEARELGQLEEDARRLVVDLEIVGDDTLSARRAEVPREQADDAERRLAGDELLAEFYRRLYWSNVEFPYGAPAWTQADEVARSRIARLSLSGRAAALARALKSLRTLPAQPRIAPLESGFVWENASFESPPMR